MDPLDSATVIDDLAIGSYRQQKCRLCVAHTVFGIYGFDEKATAFLIDFDHAVAYLRNRQLYGPTPSSLDNERCVTRLPEAIA